MISSVYLYQTKWEDVTEGCSMKETARFKIRRADKRDISQIIENWKQLMSLHTDLWAKFYRMKADAEKIYLKFLKKQMKSRKAAVFVAGSHGCVIAHIMAEITRVPPIFKIDKQCYIYEIFVKKEFRKRGIGAALIKTVEEWAKRRKIKQTALNVDVKNRNARELYENLGYEAYQLKMIKII